MSNRIATSSFCESLSSGVYLGDLIDTQCPTYEMIVGSNKFKVNGSYTSKQLVKEEDISVRRNVNHGILYGEWDLASAQTVNNNLIETQYYLVYKLTCALLYKPKADITFNVRVNIGYKVTSNMIQIKTSYISFTHKVSDGVYSQLISYPALQLEGVIGIPLESKQLNINWVNVELLDMVNNSTQPEDGYYEYDIVGKQLDYVQRSLLDIKNIKYQLSSVTDNTNLKLQLVEGNIDIRFNKPTGSELTNINTEIDYDETNMKGIYLKYDITSYPSTNRLTESHKIQHEYGNLGYKVDHVSVCFHLIFEGRFDKKIYLVAPLEVSTGIELTDLISDDEEE